ncbi:MAG TPA: right-handed parallel beta-helix repeat-containing protein [Methanoculleus sp.]|nr:right-handed parallel beta-helix repeat-containing protein [Methanoculleus sp.]
MGAILAFGQAAAAADVAPNETANITTPVMENTLENSTSLVNTTPATVAVEGSAYTATAGNGDVIASGSNAASVIQAAVDFVPDGGVVEIQQGTYPIASTITAKKSITLRGIGMPVFKSATKDYLIECKGTLLASSAPAEDVPANSTMVRVNDASGLAAGDLILIFDTTQWNPDDDGWYQRMKTGELHRVQSVTENEIAFDDPLLHTYSLSKNANVQFIKPVSVTIEGITILGGSKSGDYSGISLRYTIDSTLRDCHIDSCGLRATHIMDCYETTIAHCTIENAEKKGYGYGVDVHSSSAYTRIIDSTIDRCRHCITHVAHPGSSIGVPRETFIERNYLRGSIAHTIDAHPCAESWYIYNNEITHLYGNKYLVNNGAKYCEVKGNTLHDGFGCRKRQDIRDITFIIENNTFIDVKQCADTTDRGTMRYFEFSNNTCTDCQNFMVKSTIADDVRIAGNTYSGSHGGEVILVKNADQGSIEENSIEGSLDGRISVQGCMDVLVKGNTGTGDQAGNATASNQPALQN